MGYVFGFYGFYNYRNFLNVVLNYTFGNFLKTLYYLLFTYGSFILHLYLSFHYLLYLHRIIFWKSIHLEVASGTFCLLVNSPWLLVFSLVMISFIFVGFNIYCWAGIHFSWSNILILIHLNFGLIYSFHIWSRDLLRELSKKYEILLMVLFILFGGFLVSEALLFISFFWGSFHSLSAPTLGMWP